MADATAPLPDRQAVLKQALREIKQLRSQVESAERAKNEPTAVLGMSCRFPGADDPEALWRLLRDGVDATGEAPLARWRESGWALPEDGSLIRRGGFLADPLAAFDARFFNISPVEAAAIDPQHRLFWEVAWEALENAGRPASELRGSRSGVFLGITTSDYAHVALHGRPLDELNGYAMGGTCLNFAAGRLSYMLGLEGPSMAIDTACSSSLVAVHLACQSLRNGEIDLAIVGGVNLILSPANSALLGKLRALSPDGRCKTFDAAADGYGRAEGCGVVILTRASDAATRADPVLALLRGSAVGQDGFTSGPTVPSAASQENVIRQALAQANVRPADIGYIEAHGTGTALGDPIELRALAAALRHDRPADRPFWLGSIKANIGHPESAAGIAALIKVILCLQHAAIPRQLHVRRPNPLIAWEEIPARIPRELTAWPRADTPRFAGVSSFGASGTNAHVVVAEAPPLPAAEANAAARTHYVLPLSARRAESLRALAESYQQLLAADPSLSLLDVAATASTGRSHFEHRLALVARDGEDARCKLAAFAHGEPTGALAVGSTHGTARPRVAFLFTGQGAQYPGMGRQLYETCAPFRSAIDACARVLDPVLDHPLTAILYPSAKDSELIHQTRYTQPALFALEYALACVWRSWGVEPDAVVGHSLGEIVAACFAGVLSLEDALRFVAERGRLIQELPEGGGMLACFASEAAVLVALGPFGDQLSIAAVNAPEEVVVSGALPALRELQDRLTAAGIKNHPLRVSHAFHSALVEPALAELERAAASCRLAPPRLAVISNVTGAPATAAELTSPGYWRAHARAAVRFADGMRTLHAQGYEVFVEIGPKPVLGAMGRRCLPDGEGRFWASLRKGQDEWQTLYAALAELYAAGYPIDWQGVYGARRARPVTLPTYPFQRDRHWLAAPAATSGRAGHAARFLPERAASPIVTAYQAQLDARAWSLLRDHVVHDRLVVSGVFHMAMALYAAEEEPELPVLEDVVFRSALILSEDEPRTAQLVLPAPDRFELYTAPGTDTSSWTLHTTGRIAECATLARSHMPELVSAARTRCTEQLTGDAFYAQPWARLHAIGPSLSLIQHVHRRDGEALVELRPPAFAGEAEARAARALPERWTDLLLSAASYEACAQAFRAALPVDDVDIYIGLSMERVAQLRDAHRGRYGHVVVRRADVDGELIVDLTLLDASCHVLAKIDGFHMRRLRSEVWDRPATTAPARMPPQRAAPIAAAPSRAQLLELSPAARTQQLEQYVRDAVAAVSGVSAADIHPDASLRDAGIDSLQAVDLRTFLQSGLGVTLPLGTLIEGPSVAQLAAKLSQELTGAGAPRTRTSQGAPPSAAERWFRRRRTAVVPRSRLFCFPLGGAGASLFRGWQDGLRANVEVCAAQLPGREDRRSDAPFTRMSELVRALADAMGPLLDRPYALFGASMGGLLAFELAHRLRAQYGRDPQHLFIAATTAPTSRNATVEALAMQTGPQALDPAALARVGIIPQSLLLEPDLLEAALPAIRSDFSLVATYRHHGDELLSCPVSVLGGTRDPLVTRPLLEGWRALTTNSCALHMLDSDHQFVKSDRDRVIAILSDALEADSAGQQRATRASRPNGLPAVGKQQRSLPCED